MKIKRLLVNGMTTPVGIGSDRPVFSFDTDTETGIFGVDVWEEDTNRTVAECTVNAEMRKQFHFLKPFREGTCYGWAVTDGECREVSRFETGMLPNAPFIGAEGATQTLPLFTRTFFADTHCQKARLYLTCVGLYRAFLNGERVGRQYLTGNDGDAETLFTQTYDVTDLIWYGAENEIRVVLCGENACFSARLLMTDGTGGRRSVCTDPAWRVSESGVVCDPQHVYESWVGNLREQKGFACLKSAPSAVPISNGDHPSFVPKKIHFPIRVSDSESVDGRIFDFGRTVNGTVRIRGSLPCGCRFDAVCAETKDFSSPSGTFSVVSDGLARMWEPFFFCVRFRYVCVTVSSGKEDITAEAVELKKG